MLRPFLAVIYTAFALGANPAVADSAVLAGLREGDMRKLAVHARPVEVPQTAFFDPGGKTHRLADWQGRHVLVNFWATWCAPCRHEMPSLDRLEAEFGGPDFAVVTIATGRRNALPAIEKFFADAGVSHLPILLDPRSALAREMGVLALPVSVLIAPDGREMGRLTGDADWHAEAARKLVATLIGAQPAQ